MPSQEIRTDEQDPNEGTDAAEVEHCMPAEFVCEDWEKVIHRIDKNTFRVTEHIPFSLRLQYVAVSLVLHFFFTRTRILRLKLGVLKFLAI